MNNYNMFNQSPIRKIKMLKVGKQRVSMGLIVGIALTLALMVLSTVSISDAEAIFVRDGDFKIGMATSGSVVYEGDPLVVTLFLTNVSAETKFVSFKNNCQATYKIVNSQDQTVYPIAAEDTPCNNSGYEEFLFYPQDIKRYFFRLVRDENKSLTLTEGTYKIIGTIEGFGSTEPKKLSVLKRPKTTVSEGELCQGLTAKSCDPGLECKFEGGFPGGAGMCLAVDNNFEPANICISGKNGCFKDVENLSQQNLIQKYLIQGKIPAIEDGNFKPDEAIRITDAQEIIKRNTGKNVRIKGDLISKAAAVKVLYQIYFYKNPEVIDKSPFTDVDGHELEKYIISSYQLGLLNFNSQKLFFPDRPITRIEFLSLIDEFENLK